MIFMNKRRCEPNEKRDADKEDLEIMWKGLHTSSPGSSSVLVIEILPVR